MSLAGVVLVVSYNQKIARRRATLDLIMLHQSNDGIVKDRKRFIQLRDKAHLAQWAAPDKADSEEATVIKSVLNHYELVAIGVRQKTLHENIYKRWLRSGFVKDWIESKPFVVQLRQNTQNHKIYCEFESLARRWANKKEKELL